MQEQVRRAAGHLQETKASVGHGILDHAAESLADELQVRFIDGRAHCGFCVLVILPRWQVRTASTVSPMPGNGISSPSSILKVKQSQLAILSTIGASVTVLPTMSVMRADILMVTELLLFDP
jgi:hypothetical protein